MACNCRCRHCSLPSICDCLLYFLVRHQGIHRKAAEELAALRPQPTSAAACKLRAQLLEFLQTQAQEVREGECLLGSSEVLESIIGKFKCVAGERGQHGLTGMVLSIGALVGHVTGAGCADGGAQPGRLEVVSNASWHDVARSPPPDRARPLPRNKNGNHYSWAKRNPFTHPGRESLFLPFVRGLRHQPCDAATLSPNPLFLPSRIAWMDSTPWQFSLRSLLLFVAAVAMSCSVAKIVPEQGYWVMVVPVALFAAAMHPSANVRLIGTLMVIQFLGGYLLAPGDGLICSGKGGFAFRF